MSYFDDASLVLIPSGYKTNKVYSVKPTDGTGDLTFSRASTATRVNASGLVEAVASGLPRLDYLGSTCPKLLLEPQRTNSITYSEQLDNAAWTKDNGSVTANAIASPDGSTNADLFTENTSTGNHRVYGSALTTSANQPLTFSVFAKYNGRQYVYLRTDVIVPKTAVFDIQNGTTGEVSSESSSKIENYGNGWYRLTLTVNALVGNTATCEGLVGLLNGNSYANNVYTGNGTAGAYLWGFQAELNSAYATSYIPTLGASVTRVADAASKTGISSLIGSTAGTVFYEGIYSSVNTTNTRLVVLKGAGTTYQDIMIFQDNQDGTFNVQFRDSALTLLVNITWTHGLTNGQSFKVGFAYANNDVVVYQNGLSKGTDTSYAPLTFTDFYLQYTDILGKTETKQALLFKTRLTNAQLAELTT
jgi:hypothetical protein